MQRSDHHVETIREAFRYTQAFSGKIFILQLDDSITSDSAWSSLVRDLVLLHNAGIRIAVVAGARRRIEEVLDRYGVVSTKHQGIRISSPETIPFIKMAAFDVANRIMTLLSGFGVNAVIGNWVRARSLGVVNGTDFRDSGTVHSLRADLLSGVIEQGSIPILTCIGWSQSGRPYNVSSRELATRVAVALGAAKLFFVSSPGVLHGPDYRINEAISVAPDGRISRMGVDQVRDFVDLNSDKAEDTGLEMVGWALEAAQQGVERVHLLDGQSDGVLLGEIFSNLGVGTMIHANQYQSVRPMRRDDVADVHRLMRPLIHKGLLIPRSETDLAEAHGDYVVFETDGMVHGCGALHRYPNGDPAHGEIAGLAVDPEYDHLGIGNRIVSFLIDRARSEAIGRVFALTTQASDWFEQLGFVPGKVEDVPIEKRSVYDRTRNSRILIYDLQ